MLTPSLRAESKAGIPSAGSVDFNREIRPILSDNCFACHGPDEGARKAKLRLDHREGALKGGKSGDPAIIPGKPDESELIKRIMTSDEDDLMPPPKSKKKLTATQMDLLKRWVAEGAAWPSHWAFEKPQRAPLPETALKNWAKNEIDRFVLARLEKEGLKPSPQADKPTLIRRASLDLTGLPPTVEEVDAFLNDSSATAYEKLVDRLLDSSRYGEHMAKSWLDAVRYADSHGYHIDSQRDIWPYREWVIKALNQNIPFDEFTAQQLAGDLLPNATTDQKIASGYVRCNMSTGEGGAIEAEYQSKYAFDRTETTGTIWLGLTLVCSRCHTHKYDPILQREYYGLYAFFNNLNEPVMDGNKPNPDPFLPLPTAEQKARQAELKGLITDTQTKIDRPVAELDDAQRLWQTDWHQKLKAGWALLAVKEAKATSTSGTAFKTLEGGSILAEPGKSSQEIYEIATKLDPGKLGALRLEAIPHKSLPAQGSGRAQDGRFRLMEIEAEIMSAKAEGKPMKLRFAHATADSAEASHEAAKAIDGNSDTGWSISTNAITEMHNAIFVLGEAVSVAAEAELRIRLRFEGADANRALGHFRFTAAQDAQLVNWLIPPKPDPWRVIGPFKTEGLQAGLSETYEPEKEIDLKKSYPGVREEVRWNVRGDLEDGKRHLLVHDLHGVHGAYYFYRTIKVEEDRKAQLSLRADDLFKIWLNGQLVLERSNPAKPTDSADKVNVNLQRGENKILVKVVNHQGAAYFAFDKDLGRSETLAPEIAPVLAATEKPVNNDASKVRNSYRREHSDEFKQLFAERDRLQSEQSSLERTIPTTIVAKEMEKPRETFMLMRGEYDKVSEKVTPGVPSILPPLPPDAPLNRLTLAKWLTSAEHPLTARVTVNRHWQQYFGVGLVKTAEDFGIQGERPSHPDLLDWLATEFIGTGWDVKRLQRLIVTSATYRQSSKLTPELRGRDPENRLLARGPRFRVDGEVLRDMALYVGGMMVEKQGGRSVKPFEPPGLWEAVSFNNSQKYVPDTGEGQYRRSLYTYWKRQSPPPNMLIFDAPTREYCVVRRPRTNTPLQALTLLNDPQFVEASRAFAQRILLEGGDSIDSRIAYGFRLATARAPAAEEIYVLR
ncbi:MAG: PSD1 and planctomycete cytochrome C domain-containing protein, partial [Verrucomicrobiales bacterium]|nr:PSD1 and planctomycete cytochrome C domain-containing protein [Verrucomicrobiales bacterium]